MPRKNKPKPKTAPQPSIQPEPAQSTRPSTSPFFSKFTAFTPDPTASLSSDFHRLAQTRKWKKGSRTWKKMWNLCLSEEYDHLIGKDLSNLQNWQRLCEEVGLTGVKDMFTSIKKCKMALSKVYVNLVDLLDCRRMGTKVKTFRSVGELSAYTKRTDKVFSRVVVKRDKLLKVLLKTLI